MNILEREDLRAYLQSAAFLEPLGLPAGTALDFAPLGQGEYNLNYVFSHPHTGKRWVLRLNTGSQMHLADQVSYEFSALEALRPAGRTPRPLFCDGSRRAVPYGVLVMEWLPGRALDYARDLPAAAELLADIHALPVAPDCPLLRPEHPARAIYDECLELAARYFRWDGADAEVCRYLEALIAEIGALPLSAPAPGPRCIVNTELNSGNFLINPGARSYLVDWEKPLLSEPAQDLGHFLAPTTTFWKTDTILGREEIRAFTARYLQAAEGRLDCAALRERLPLFFTVTCLRGVSWCAMATVEYSRPDRPLQNEDTRSKLRDYLSPDFLSRILEDYVRRDFLGEGRA